MKGAFYTQLHFLNYVHVCFYVLIITLRIFDCSFVLVRMTVVCSKRYEYDVWHVWYNSIKIKSISCELCEQVVWLFV